MYTTAYVLRHTECGGQRVNCAGRMCQDGESVDFQLLADRKDVIWKAELKFW